jgi:hypothetical protein
LAPAVPLKRVYHRGRDKEVAENIRMQEQGLATVEVRETTATTTTVHSFHAKLLLLEERIGRITTEQAEAVAGAVAILTTEGNGNEGETGQIDQDRGHPELTNRGTGTTTTIAGGGEIKMIGETGIPTREGEVTTVEPATRTEHTGITKPRYFPKG